VATSGEAWKYGRKDATSVERTVGCQGRLGCNISEAGQETGSLHAVYSGVSSRNQRSDGLAHGCCEHQGEGGCSGSASRNQIGPDVWALAGLSTWIARKTSHAKAVESPIRAFAAAEPCGRRGPCTVAKSCRSPESGVIATCKPPVGRQRVSGVGVSGLPTRAQKPPSAMIFELASPPPPPPTAKRHSGSPAMRSPTWHCSHDGARL